VVLSYNELIINDVIVILYRLITPNITTLEFVNFVKSTCNFFVGWYDRDRLENGAKNHAPKNSSQNPAL